MLPPWLLRLYYGKDIETQLNQRAFGFDPRRSFGTSGIMINSDIAPRIISEQIKMKPDICCLTKDSAILVDESCVEIDDIILCTGYQPHFPFLEKSIFFGEEGEMMLYKRVFPPKLAAIHPTLAFVGMIRIAGLAIPVCELHARWAASVLSGICTLPSQAKMLRSVEETTERT